MPQLSPNSIQIMDGEITLTKHNRTSRWQARFKADGKWQRVTTKEKDLKEATKVAKDLYLEAQYRTKLGVPAVSRRFKSVAQLATKRMKDALEAGTGKVVFNDYIIVTEKYLIPFFGSKHIDQIDNAQILAFNRWRDDQMGRVPKASTINTHNSALNRIFEEGVIRGYVTHAQLPQLKNDGDDGERRPDFSLQEYRKLYRFMRVWVRSGRKGKNRDMRYLLRDYVLILANTGMRHGTESYGLKWKGIRVEKEKDGKRYIYLSVNGKTGQRELVARSGVWKYLDRIRSRADDLKHMSLEEVIEKGIDQHVFRLPDGSHTKQLNGTFEVLLTDAGLLIDRRTEQKRTLYSLRHSYATWQLAAHKSIHLLARQMGTSVGMIERHYSHITVMLAKEELSR